MRRIATDGLAWSVGMSVCLSVTTVIYAEVAERIVWWAKGTIYWMGVYRSPHVKGSFEGEGRPIIKYRDS